MRRFVNILLLSFMGVALSSVGASWSAPSASSVVQRDLQSVLQKAGPTKKTIELPSGDWVVSSSLVVDKNITLKLGKAARIAVAPGSVLTVRGLLQAPVTDIFIGTGEVVFDSDLKQKVYPQWWGAKGDGVSDDTITVQAAINSFSSKGGELFIPEGTYIVDTIGVKSNITVRGYGSRSILKQKSGAKFCITTNPNNSKIRRGGSVVSNITFTELTFRGTVDTDGFSEFFMLLDIRGASNVSITRCNFTGFRGDGIYIGDVKIAGKELHNSNIKVSECIFDGINKDNRNGISIIDCDGLLIEKCTFINCSRTDMPGAIDVEPNEKYDTVKNISIKGNRFENIGGNNIIQISIPFKLSKLDSPLQNVEITKNVIEGDGKANGIYVGQSQLSDDRTTPNSIVISDNVVRNTKRSFMVFGVKGVKIANNVFEDCDESPCLSYSEKNINIMNVMITGNTFKDLSRNDGAGISIFGARHLELRGNTFDNIGKVGGAGGNALFFRRQGGPVDYVTIENNTFKGDNTTVAIQREFGSETFQEHNRVKNNIFLSSDKVFLPADN